MNFATHHALLITLFVAVAIVMGVVGANASLAQTQSANVEGGVIIVDAPEVINQGETFTIDVELEYDLPLQDTTLRVKNTRRNEFLQGEVEFNQEFEQIILSGAWTDTIATKTEYDVFIGGAFGNSKLYDFTVDVTERTTSAGSNNPAMVPRIILEQNFFEFEHDTEFQQVFRLSDAVDVPEGQTVEYYIEEVTTRPINDDASYCFVDDVGVQCGVIGTGKDYYVFVVYHPSGSVEKEFSIMVKEEENIHPEIDLPAQEVLTVNEEFAVIFDLEQYAFDLNGDDITYVVDLFDTTTSAASQCFIENNAELVCAFYDVGTVTYEVKVFDNRGGDNYDLVEFIIEEPSDSVDGSEPDGTTGNDNGQDTAGTDPENGDGTGSETDTSNSEESSSDDATDPSTDPVTDSGDGTTSDDESTINSTDATSATDDDADNMDDDAGTVSDTTDGETDTTENEVSGSDAVATRTKERQPRSFDKQLDETNPDSTFGTPEEIEQRLSKNSPFFEDIPEETIAERQERLEEIKERFSSFNEALEEEVPEEVLDREVLEDEIFERLRFEDRIIERRIKDVVDEKELPEEIEEEFIEELIETRIEEILFDLADDEPTEDIDEPVEDDSVDEVIEEQPPKKPEVVQTTKSFQERQRRGEQVVAVKKALFVERITPDDPTPTDTDTEGSQQSTVVLTVTPQEGNSDIIEIVEVIPKEIAASAQDIDFNIQPIILEDDPIVMWQLQDIEETIELSYSVDKEIEVTGNTIALAEEPAVVIREERASAWETIRPLLFIPLAILAIIFITRHRQRDEPLKKF